MRRFLPVLLTLSLGACSPELREFACDNSTPCPNGQDCRAGVCQPTSGDDDDDAEADLSLDLAPSDGADDGPTGDGVGDTSAPDAGDAADTAVDSAPPSDADGEEDDAPGDPNDLDASCGADASGDPPTVDLDSLPTELDAGARRFDLTLDFSEPVWGLDRRSVTVDNGAIVWQIATTDREHWEMEVAGLWNSGGFTLALSDAIHNAAGVSLAAEDRQWTFTVGGTVLYVVPGATGGGLSRTDPMCCIQNAIDFIEDHALSADVLVAGGDYQGPIVLRGGIGIFGGFSAAFTERDPETYVSRIETTGSYTVFADGSDHNPNATVDGFTLVSQYALGATVQLSNDSDATFSHNLIRRTGEAATPLAVLMGDSGALLLENEISARGQDTVIGVGVSGSPIRSPRIYYNRISTVVESNTGTGIGIDLQHTDWPAEVVGNRVNGSVATGSAELIGIDLGADAQVFNNLISAGLATGEDAACRGIEVSGGSGLIVNNIIDGGACGDRTIAVVLYDEPDVSLVNNVLFTIGAGASVDAGILELEYESDPLAVQHNLIFDVTSLYVDEAGDTHHTDISTVNSGLAAAVDRGCGDGCETAQVGGNVTLTIAPGTFFVDFDGTDGLPHTLPDNDWHYARSDVAELGLDTGTPGCGTVQSPHQCGPVTDDADGALRTVPVSIGAYELEPECP